MPHRHHLHLPHLPERWTLGRIQNPVRGMLHGTAALAAVAGVVWLLADSPNDGVARKAALAVFGLALVVLFTVSTLYHTVPWGPVWKKRMQKLDHSSIFVVVAASYTPIAVIVLESWMTWSALLLAWGGATLGIGQIWLYPRETLGFSIALNTTLGFFGLLFIKALFDRLPVTAILVLAAGGLMYLIGMILLVTERPRLWPRVFSYHEAMHVLVVAAAATFWFGTWRWVAPFA